MNSEAATYDTPVNLGNPDEYTILDFAKKIRARINPKIAIEHLPATKDDPKQRRPDISRAKALLNWSPQVSVDEGLAYTIKYFAEELEIALPPDAAALPADWTHHDEALGRPTWVAQVVNNMLTDAEKGLVAKDVKPPMPE